MRAYSLILLSSQLLVFVMVSPSFSDSVDDEYTRRFQALARDDVRGHEELAKWLHKQERWQLLAQQCRYVLRIAPNNRPATLMLDLARLQLEKESKHSPNTDSPDKGGPPTKTATHCGDAPAALTDDEVDAVRRAELNLDAPEHVTVRIDRKLLKQFIEEYENAPGFPVDRRAFFRLNPTEQAQLMLKYAREKYRESIVIRGEPERLKSFTRNVMPFVLANCATAECHGGTQAGCFRLQGGRSLGTNVAYANFIAMQSMKVDDHPLINRNTPKRSLLLTYGLPAVPGDDFKAYNHPVDISPIFKDQDDRDYRMILDWLRSLDIEKPDYGIATGRP